MPHLNLDNIDNELFVQLNELAAVEGESVEELVQAILRKAVEEKHTQHLATLLINRFSSIGLNEGETLSGLRGQQVQPPNFGQ